MNRWRGMEMLLAAVATACGCGSSELACHDVFLVTLNLNTNISDAVGATVSVRYDGIENECVLGLDAVTGRVECDMSGERYFQARITTSAELLVVAEGTPSCVEIRFRHDVQVIDFKWFIRSTYRDEVVDVEGLTCKTSAVTSVVAKCPQLY